MSGRRALVVFAVVVAGISLGASADAQVLGGIEDSHRPPATSTPSSSTSRPSRSRSSSSSSSSSSSTSDGSSFVWPCLIIGPWTGYCIYGKSWLRADRSESVESRVPRIVAAKDFVGRDVPSESDREEGDDQPRGIEALPAEVAGVAPRYGEIQGAGFLGMTHKVYAHELSARAYAWVGGLSASWLRLYEPESPMLQSLDLMRFSTFGTAIAASYVELHVLMGVDVLHGEGWTPAFGPGLELRTYPTRQFTVGGAVQASIFADGYPLVDSRLEMGAVFGRLDVRLGGRWLYQHYQRAAAASLFGPTVSVLIRLGP